jgi:hypothetical protein
LLDKELETNETTALAMQRPGKRTSATVELLLETVFSAWSVRRGYLEDKWGGARKSACEEKTRR